MYYKTYMNDVNFPLHSPAAVGETIRQKRKLAGLSQEALATAAGVKRRVVADLESGRNVGTHVLLTVLSRLGDRIEIVPDDGESYSNALLALCRTASTSYAGEVPPVIMENFFLTGEVPPRWSTHIDYALEESPPMLFEKAIAAYQQPVRKRIRENLRAWASKHNLHVPEEFGLA
jgi:transcriptional regulator with XRE-family HTH domain